MLKTEDIRTCKFQCD